MSVSVDVVGKLVQINVTFKDVNGVEVAAPSNVVYNWTVLDDENNDVITIAMIGDNGEICKVTPQGEGTATVSLTVNGEGLMTPLTGTLEIEVLSMEPASIQLNGTVIDAD